jgi:hypothetical protein
MIHQAGSTRIDAALELGRAALLDDIGRCFRDLRVIVAHCGHPWVDEALFLLTMLRPWMVAGRADGFHDRTDPRYQRYLGDEFAGIDAFPFASPELSLPFPRSRGSPSWASCSGRWWPASGSPCRGRRGFARSSRKSASRACDA